LHGDVFRKPRFAKLLATTVGSGVEILGMSCVTLIFAALGLFSPAHCGGLLQSMMLLFTFMGVCEDTHRLGFLSSGVGRSEDWKMATLMTAFLYPGATSPFSSF
jgi:transmembrane 9 superfamily protein 2/4